MAADELLIGSMSASAADGAVQVSLVRSGQVIERTITPVMHRGTSGRCPASSGDRHLSYQDIPGARQRYYSIGKALDRAGDYWVRIFQGTMKMLGNMVTGATTMKESVGGPVAIFQVASQTVEEGWFVYVKLMAQIGLGLGVINLLPVPVLDGGQIIFYSLEALQTTAPGVARAHSNGGDFVHDGADAPRDRHGRQQVVRWMTDWS